jgi:hypothetical protein
MDNCTVCKGENLQFFLKIDQLIYWTCNFCEAKFLDKKNYISHNAEKKHYLKHNNNMSDQGYRDFLSCLIKPLKDKISQKDFGLDYGCGYSPTLADILKKDGFNVDVYDPFFFLNQNIFLKKYNFITCSEVVEHFFKPYEEFIKIDNLMTYNGWFGVMTSFLTEDKIFKNWHYRRDPTHVVFYKKKTFEVIANQRHWNVSFPSRNIAIFNKMYPNSF